VCVCMYVCMYRVEIDDDGDDIPYLTFWFLGFSLAAGWLSLVVQCRYFHFESDQINRLLVLYIWIDDDMISAPSLSSPIQANRLYKY